MKADTNESTTACPLGPRARAWRVLGSVSVAIGIVNAFIPLLPTTVFLLIGLWAYGKGAPELHARLLAHPRYGESLRLWSERRMLTRSAKWKAALVIAAGFAITAAITGPGAVTAGVGAGLLVLTLFLATRAEPPRA